MRIFEGVLHSSELRYSAAKRDEFIFRFIVSKSIFGQLDCSHLLELLTFMAQHTPGGEESHASLLREDMPRALNADYGSTGSHCSRRSPLGVSLSFYRFACYLLLSVRRRWIGNNDQRGLEMQKLWSLESDRLIGYVNYMHRI